jgi:cytochrome c oxidase cbb3-type subunit I/II
MYIAGVTQGLMWKQFNPQGTLMYPNFLETVTQLIPMYMIRAIGGTIYLTGALLMVYNLIKTAKQGSFVKNEKAQAAPLPEKYVGEPGDRKHRFIERKPMILLVLSTVVILIGGAIEIIPMLLIKSNVPTIASVKPLTPLELYGRDMYIREGCYTCHSQMIRPFRSETERYGEYSKVGEFVYDHPFQWGSKRSGPDLQREGGKYPSSWHYQHMFDPRQISPGSIMPAFPWMLTNRIDFMSVPGKISAMTTLGVPYPVGYSKLAVNDLKIQAQLIVDQLKAEGIPDADPNKEIIAIIAYLQRLGTDIKVK